MKMALSDFDKKILFELDKDGRASFSAIAKALSTTPQVVKYHYNQLIARGVIDKFWAFVDYDRAGYSFFWGYWFKFSGMSKETEEAMYAYLRAHPRIPIVMRSDGYANLFIAIIAEDVFRHNTILQEFTGKYGEFIAENDIVVGLGFEKFPRGYLLGGHDTPQEKALSGGTTNTAKLSELDRKMLSLLQEDGRMDFTQMAHILSSSPSLVQKHYHKLVNDAVITKTTYTLNFEKAGLLYYRVLFKVAQFDPARVEAFHTFCATHPNIVNYVNVMGNWQLMLDIEIESRETLRDILQQIRYSFRDVVYQIEVNEIYKIEKFTQMAIEYPELSVVQKEA